ncbi:MAG TPA: hypothetical protein VMM38_06245 [Aridibacter sp.]|nr:hypothetical protein [Aridibacter sp.]
MDDCCVDTLKEIHDVAEYVWRFQRFVPASPFVLIIPEFDPTADAKDLVWTGTQKAGEMLVSKALNVMMENMSLPDLLDTVKNLGKIAVGKQMQLANYHELRHAGKDPAEAAFWRQMGQTYKDAFYG